MEGKNQNQEQLELNETTGAHAPEMIPWKIVIREEN